MEREGKEKIMKIERIIIEFMIMRMDSGIKNVYIWVIKEKKGGVKWEVKK